MIYQVDPYKSVYEFEKMQDPSFNYGMRPVKRTDINFIDKMLELTQGKKSVVTTQDWDNLRDIVTFFSNRWPQEFREFKQSIDLIRSTRSKDAKSESGEMMYVGALPLRLERFIKRLYPEQRFDKEFLWKLVKKMPVFRVTGVNN